jgi:glycosyltransferase involved in cell wall biosynthesis
MQDVPIVSVILATFNEPKGLILESIDSILNQSLKDLELLIVDDSTNNETKTAIDQRSQSDERIKVHRSNKVRGFAKSLNIGLKNARGKYIARMDADDIALRPRLDIQVKFLEENPKYSLLGGSMNIIDENGKIISKRDYPRSSLGLKLWTILRNPMAHPTVMMRRSIIDNGYFYDEEFPKAEDLELWLRLMRNNFKIYNLRDVLVNYRIIGNLSTKRVGENFIYNYKARCKNFSWRSPFSGLISLFIAKIYTLLPKYVVSRAYSLRKKKI